ncbi:hypothetical protein MIR68_005616 [Amoeboaphelidium protococcarum]|nr:hypothetical protein MIR68_005616 [Amoeboaphelidium protococcarum]
MQLHRKTAVKISICILVWVFISLLIFNQRVWTSTRHLISRYSADNLEWYRDFVDNQYKILNGEKRFRAVLIYFHPATGNCNRIMSLVSGFLLALVTKRALILDWDNQDSMSLGPEEISQASFYDLFARLPFPFLKSEIGFNLKRYSSVHLFKKNGVYIDNCFDLSTLDQYDILKIDYYLYWGHIIAQNDLYADYIQQIGYPVFKRVSDLLFQPSAAVQAIMDRKSVECGVGVQIRRRWDRPAATDQQYADASLYLRNLSLVGSNRPLVLANDLPVDMSRFNYGINNSTIELTDPNNVCRTGTQCIQEGIADMFLLSKCKQLITTFSSTFARCSAGFSNTRPFVMYPSGQYYQEFTSEPLEAGALEHGFEIMPQSTKKCSIYRGHFQLIVESIGAQSATISWIALSFGKHKYIVTTEQLSPSPLSDLADGVHIDDKRFISKSSHQIFSSEKQLRHTLTDLKADTQYRVKIWFRSLTSRHVSVWKQFRTDVQQDSFVPPLPPLNVSHLNDLHIREHDFVKYPAAVIVRISRGQTQLKAWLRRFDIYFNLKFNYDVVIAALEDTDNTLNVPELRDVSYSKLILGRASLDVCSFIVPKLNDDNNQFHINYEYLWVIDDDLLLTDQILKDPVQMLKDQSAAFGIFNEMLDVNDHQNTTLSVQFLSAVYKVETLQKICQDSGQFTLDYVEKANFKHLNLSSQVKLIQSSTQQKQN